jgi:two-component system sensor kinase FixL
MGQMASALAHELNQPLTAILNNAQVAQQLLQSGDPGDRLEMREILDDIVADDKRAAGLIHRLRLLLQKGDLEFASLDLNGIVGEVAWLVRHDALLRNVSLRLAFDPDLPAVRGDRVQLQQVVLNLVLNALEAMRAPRADPRTLVIRTAPEGVAAVCVAVQDSGPGIDEKDRDRMFAPLYTTKPGGLGMGLAIARTIVGAHGGRLAARNNADGGATFQFILPVAKAAAR